LVDRLKDRLLQRAVENGFMLADGPNGTVSVSQPINS